MKTAPCILIVEDDSKIIDYISKILRLYNYTTLIARTAFGAIHAEKNESPDLILLDLGLPDADGAEVIRCIRQKGSDIPIIVLSERESCEEKVKSLDLGADDYMTKPFDTSEFLARVRSALRRRNSIFDIVVYQKRDLSINFEKQLVTKGNEVIYLTQTEYKIITALIKRAGRVVAHEDIINYVWGENSADNNKVLRVYIASIRKKLKDDYSDPKFIYTVSGVGYRIAEPESDEIIPYKLYI